MDKNKDSELRLEEFIESYIFLEEKIKTKKIKVEKMIEDIDLDLEKYKKNLSKHQNEVPICNGLTNESTLYVTVFEAKDLVPTGVLGSCDPFVSLTFEDQKEKTQLRRGTLKPAWNEEFMFQVKDPESALAIEVFDQTMVGSELIGKLNISLNDLRDQEKKTAWFNLNLDNTPGNQGSIRLKLQCILSFVSYYTEKINQLQKEKDFLTKNLETLQYYVEKMDQPFGIIYCGEIDQILKQNLLKQTDALLEQLESSRQKIYAYRKDNDVALSMKVENIFKSTLKTNNIPWSKLTQSMMSLLVILSFISLLERSDFVNFFISVIIWMLFIYDKSYDVLKYLQPLIITIGVSLGYDLLWLILQYRNFWKGTSGDVELTLKRVTYFLCLANFVVKIILISTLTALKNKKQKASSKNVNSITK